MQSHPFMANRWENNGNSDGLNFLEFQNHFRWWLQPWNCKTLVPWKKNYDKPRQCIKKQRHYFANKSLLRLCWLGTDDVEGLNSSEPWGWGGERLSPWGAGPHLPLRSAWRQKIHLPGGPFRACYLWSRPLGPVNTKGNQSWIFTGRTDVETETTMWNTWCEEPTHWKRPWCWERMKVGGKGDDKGWDGWMASLMQWTWVWVGSGSWWWIGKPGVLKSMASQRVRHNWVNEQTDFANKGPYSQNYSFSSSQVCIWELDHKEGWVPKNWCFWTVVLEKTPESPLDCREIKLVNPKGNQSWIFTGRTDVEAEVPVLWLPDVKCWIIRKDWCWERLKAGGEEDNRGQDGWMVSPTQWTWVWANSGRWWRTGKPGMLQSMGSKRVRHNWATEQPPPL